ncbi:hypothetical protein M413DRAFT_26942 [Hebeloma cylindrosporum]|uniref:Uncharacterized protein n=1 Tax=Hebeloma cylindrosporum TaxID=76867 RepID=A0A0C2YMC1_HEBCY|nr:hypothetical protein M413DRAFT_26942 [Hebeloma cylindrosporum h7]
MASKAKESMEKESGCRIAEILQYTCVVKKSRVINMPPRTVCYPIPRILKLCPGRPAVEITKFVELDAKTGEVEIPAGFSADSVKGRPWREVIRYEEEADNNTQ